LKKQTFTNDSFSLALSFLLFGEFCGLTLDLLAKHLLETYPLSQFIFIRSVFALIIFSFIAPWYGGFESIKTKQWQWHFLRAVLSIIAMYGFFYGITKMPLVNTLTLVFIAPLIVTALSPTLLKEKVGWRRWIAVILGFIGVLIILRPGNGTFSLASLSVVASAFAYALLAITARKLASTESTIAMSVYVLVGPLIASLFFLSNNYNPPTKSAWIIFFLAGVASVGVWLGYISAYKKSSPLVLAPFEYVALIGAAIAGYLIWDEIPDRYVVLGAFIIICSGIFVAYREMDQTSSTRYLRGFRTAGINLLRKKFLKK
jgi:drug/metabolite transporter (DMT)-like permease